MINKLSKVLLLLLLVFGYSNFSVVAQSQKDSSNLEIKKQALEMREKLNVYLADKLDEDKNIKLSGQFSGLVNDSLLKIIALQSNELQVLREKYKNLEVLVEYLNSYNQMSAEKSTGPFINPSTGANYIQYANKQLNLYFAINSFTLNENQISVLTAFLNNAKSKKASLVVYTDWQGTTKTNKFIGRKRAKSVTQILKKKVKNYTLNINTNCNKNMANEGLNAQWCRRIEIVLD